MFIQNPFPRVTVKYRFPVWTSEKKQRDQHTQSQMTVPTEVQTLLESKEFIPPSCIQHVNDTGPVEMREPTGAVAILSSLTVHIRRLFPTRGTASLADVEGDEEDHTGVADMKDEGDDDDVPLLVTLDDMWMRLGRRIRDRFVMTQTVREYVILADKARWVPPQKHATQKHRDRSLDPYPDDAYLIDNGVCVDGKVMNINPSRLMATRGLREDLYKAMIERHLRDVQLEHFDIIWDVEHDVPKHARGGRAVASPADEWHEVGEDDITIVLAALRRRHDFQLFIDTVDRDQLILFLMHHRSFEKDVVLWYGDGKWVRPVELARRLEDAGWTIPMFAQTVMLTGNDFCQKTLLTSNIGVPALFAASKRYLELRPNSIDLLHDDDEDDDGLSFWLRLIYSHKLGWTRIASVSDIEAGILDRGWKKWSFPSEEAIRTAREQLSWNFHYWQSLHGQLYK
jgi:hypothetical protein